MATTSKKKTTNSAALADVIVQDNDIKELDFARVTPGTISIDDNALVNVKNNVMGELFYLDPVTQELFAWPQCGVIQPLTMANLRHMKNGTSKFFVNQLVIITGFADENAEKYEPADIYKALHITQYYKDILDPSDFEYICGLTEDEITTKIPLFSKAVQTKLVIALNTYIDKGVLDSIKAIKTFEKVLGCELKRPE